MKRSTCKWSRTRVLARFSSKSGRRAGLSKRGVVFCKGCGLTWLWFVENVALVSFLLLHLLINN